MAQDVDAARAADGRFNTEDDGLVPAPGGAAHATLESVDIAVLAALENPELVGPGAEVAVGIGAGSTLYASWTVETGDHLWHIAAESLEESWGRAVADHEVDPYWRQIIEANRATFVVADNPDLIYPGQVVRLPPIPDET